MAKFGTEFWRKGTRGYKPSNICKGNIIFLSTTSFNMSSMPNSLNTVVVPISDADVD